MTRPPVVENRKNSSPEIAKDVLEDAGISFHDVWFVLSHTTPLIRELLPEIFAFPRPSLGIGNEVAL